MTARDRPDACPGALQTHTAADGELARVRVPGGFLPGEQLRALAEAARDLGDGHLELTSRGNLQLRGLAAATDLGRRLAAVGLLPSTTHERVRNIVASALTGRDDAGHLDARPWTRELDAGLLAEPALADLPGRFLATLDDGRGDVLGLGGDVGLHALGPDEVALTLAGTDSGLRTAPATAVGLALAAARAFLAERAAQANRAWRLSELTDGPRRVTARLCASSSAGRHRSQVPSPGGGERVRPLLGGPSGPPLVANRAIGALPQSGDLVALVGLVPLGRLTPAALDVLVQVTTALGTEVQLTPWRSVVVPDLPDEFVDDVATALHSAGLVFDAASPWSLVTACAGSPGCAKSRADVRGDAARAVAGGSLPVAGPQHWAGCERRCGRPAGSTDVLAVEDGYLIGAG